MEASTAICSQSFPWINCEKALRRPNDFVHFTQRSITECCSKRSGFGHLLVRKNSTEIRCRTVLREVSCCYKNYAASMAESDNSCACPDDTFLLKTKSEEVIPYLNGRCLYLVGMMGSGKTTVGKILSEVLAYSFFDSDQLVEQAVGASVAQIFKEHNESFFRDNESKVLQDLSARRCLVVATGGGTVMQPINWRHMKQGVTVWLDVPLEALAKRIAAVGTDSRPLLHHSSGDAYKKAFLRLTELLQERGEAYTTADVRVCLQSVAAKQGHGDVSALTPTAIALEALNKIDEFLQQNEWKQRIF